ncbi:MULTISPECIES: hypothetical protein [unclassified Streptomyces]|uniref:hypothetical protein n=1 Tax=unclassified Streptomyces TaxID=2593676 RepID=UPI0033E8E71E
MHGVVDVRGVHGAALDADDVLRGVLDRLLVDGLVVVLDLFVGDRLLGRIGGGEGVIEVEPASVGGADGAVLRAQERRAALDRLRAAGRTSSPRPNPSTTTRPYATTSRCSAPAAVRRAPSSKQGPSPSSHHPRASAATPNSAPSTCTPTTNAPRTPGGRCTAAHGTRPDTRRCPSPLHQAPHLADAVAAVDVGARARILNPPPWLPPEAIELLVEGYTETLGVRTWNV